MRRRVWLLLAMVAVVLAMEACRDQRPAEVATSSAVVKRFGAEPLTLTLRLDRERLTVAEPLTVELRAEIGEDYAVKFGEAKEFAGFAVVSAKESSPELTAKNRIAVTKRYVLDPVASGSGQVPVLVVEAWKKADHQATPLTVKTEAVPIVIASLLGKDDPGDAISDIGPPLEKPVSPWLSTGIALAVVAVFLAGWYLWQRRLRRAAIPPPPLPPHLAAYQALERLVKANLLADGQIATFYQTLSDIIRHYIEQRFGLRAPERTTEEFLAELGSMGTGPMSVPAHKHLLRDFLTHCDLVKFARHTPALVEAEEAVELCRRFIRETEPSDPANGTGGEG